MRLISSRQTFLLKRVFPVLWFGFVWLWGIVALVAVGGVAGSMFLLVPAVMTVFGYFMMQKLVFCLADEVWDAGTELVVRNGGLEQRIPLSEIMNISCTVFTNPPWVTLSLRQPGPLGQEIAFSAPSRLLPFARNPIVDELIQRVDAARRASNP